MYSYVFFSLQTLTSLFQYSPSITIQQASACDPGQVGNTCLRRSGKLWHPVPLPGKPKHESEVFCRPWNIILWDSKYKCLLWFVVSNKQHSALACYRAKGRPTDDMAWYLSSISMFRTTFGQLDIRLYFLNLHKMRITQMDNTCFP